MIFEEKEIAVKIEPYGTLPSKAHYTDAGYDLYSPFGGTIPAGEMVTIDTGVRIALPVGSVGIIKSRSSLFKKGLFADGTIDCGYTGTVRVIIHNIGKESVEIKRGDRIAQLVILPIVISSLMLVDKLKDTDRGEGGFGSSGK